MCRAARKLDEAERCSECPEPEIFPENVAAISFFLSIQSQWRYDAGGLPLGLDYSGIEAAARMLGVPLGAEEFARIQLLEAEWMIVMREKHRQS